MSERERGRVRSCIKCGQSMRTRMLETVEVDCCPGCGGLWLDQGEIRQLGRFFDPRAASTLPAGATSSPYRGFRAPVVSTRSPLATPCPACGGKLSEAAFESFIIESCTACEGLYLDPGELEQAMKVVDASKAATVVALARSVSTTGSIGD
jgi:Zn-finger nucleic acid-binding protein